MRRASNRRVSNSGQSTVEFALVAPLFFLLVFGVIDFGRLFFTQMTLQHAVREAGRFAVTGRHLPDGRGGMLSRVDSIKEVAQKASAGLGGVSSGAIEVWSQSGGVGSAGGPGDTVTVSIRHDLRLITPIIGQFFNNGTYRFTVATTFKNEPFPPEQTE